MARLSMIAVLLMGAAGVFASDPNQGRPKCLPPSCWSCSSKARLTACKQPVCQPKTGCLNCPDSRSLLNCEKKEKKPPVLARSVDEEFGAENALDDIEVTF